MLFSCTSWYHLSIAIEAKDHFTRSYMPAMMLSLHPQIQEDPPRTSCPPQQERNCWWFSPSDPEDRADRIRRLPSTTLGHGKECVSVGVFRHGPRSLVLFFPPSAWVQSDCLERTMPLALLFSHSTGLGKGRVGFRTRNVSA